MPHRAVVTSNFPNPKPKPKKKRNYERNVLISRSSLEEMEPELDMLVGATTSTRRLEPLSHPTLPTGTLTLDRETFFSFLGRGWTHGEYGRVLRSPRSELWRSFQCFNVRSAYRHSIIIHSTHLSRPRRDVEGEEFNSNARSSTLFIQNYKHSAENGYI